MHLSAAVDFVQVEQGNQQAGSRLSHAIAIESLVEPHESSNNPLYTSDTGTRDTIDRSRTRPLSRRVSDMIDEAFPLPALPEDAFAQSSIEDSTVMNTSTSSSANWRAPPAYTPQRQPPQYSPDSNLAERLASPNMQEAFAIAVQYDRIPKIAPLPNHPFKTYHELMLLAPAMPFSHFVQIVEEKVTTLILSERPSKRLLPHEKVVFCPTIKLRVDKGGFLKRTKIAKSAIKADNWPAIVAVLQARPGEAEMKIKFWTERPGSAAETLGKDVTPWVMWVSF